MQRARARAHAIARHATPVNEVELWTVAFFLLALVFALSAVQVY